MVRDYLAGSLGRNPLSYAREYYEHFPKVALGHYPPAYYLAGGLVLLPMRDITALGLLQALQIGLLSALSAWLLAQRVSWLWATFLSLVWSALPYMQKFAVLVMSDFQVSLLCLAAAVAWWRYLETQTLQWSLAFGFLASAAILTKGSAWSLALVPGLALAFTGAWGHLLRWKFWAAVVPVALLALPWQIISTRITERGMSGKTIGEHMQGAIPFYTGALTRTLGILVLVTLALALVLHLWQRVRGKPMSPDLAAIWALVIATLTIALTIPAGESSRYLMPLYFPALILLVWEASRLWRAPLPRFMPAVLLPIIALTAFSQPPPLEKRGEGFSTAYHHARHGSSEDKDLRVLIVSDARGEGAVVAAAAFAEAQPDRQVTILRASKTLAEQDWLGRGLKLHADGPQATLKLLEEQAVDWIFLDTTVAQANNTPYHDLIKQALARPACGWQMDCHQSIIRTDASGDMLCYRKSSPAPPNTP
jgi:hypothetical protein